jgi:hypothetical protein
MEQEQIKLKQINLQQKKKPTLILDSLATFQVIDEVDEVNSNDGKMRAD